MITTMPFLTRRCVEYIASSLRDRVEQSSSRLVLRSWESQGQQGAFGSVDFQNKESWRTIAQHPYLQRPTPAASLPQWRSGIIQHGIAYDGDE